MSGVQHDNISKDNMEVFLTAIGRYKLEMLNDYNPVYDEDLSFCDKIMKDIVYQYVYDSDVYQRMMADREAIRVQRNESTVEDIADNEGMELEENGQTMHGI